MIKETIRAQPDCSEAPRFGVFPTLGAHTSSGLGTGKMRSIITALVEIEMSFRANPIRLSPNLRFENENHTLYWNSLPLDVV